MAGSTKCGFADGIGPNARFSCIEGVSYNPKDGYLYTSDSTNNTIRKVSPKGLMAVFSKYANTIQVRLPLLWEVGLADTKTEVLP